MKTLITTMLVIGIAINSLIYLSFILGEKSKQDEIERRVLETDCCKECVEIIIFNKSQLKNRKHG